MHEGILRGIDDMQSGRVTIFHIEFKGADPLKRF